MRKQVSIINNSFLNSGEFGGDEGNGSFLGETNVYSYQVLLGGHQSFLTGVVEVEVIFDIMGHHYMGFITFVSKFSYLA